MSKKNSLLHYKRGFSLIEVLMAITLFAFLVVGVLTMTTMGIRTNSYAQHHTKAVQLAESNMEMLRRVDYNNVLPAFDGISAEATTSNGITIHPVEDFGSIDSYGEFSRVSLVTWATDISVLRVTVTWRSQGVNSIPIVLESQRVAQ